MANANANANGAKFNIKALPAKIARSFKDMKGEVKKVVWPSKKQVINNTVIVLVAMVIAAAFIGALDFLMSALLKLFF